MLRAAAARLPDTRLAAWSRSAASRQAVADVAVTHATPAEAVRGADCVILATPVDTFADLLAAIGPNLDDGAWVTDVGSTKRAVHRSAAERLPRPGRFVGGHPMAGSEKGGAGEGRADLLEGRPCIVTSGPETDPEVTAAAARLWTALGGKPVLLTPEAHDAAVAEISHLPHAVASLLAGLLAGRHPRTDLAAGGLRDTTRVAGGDPALWVPILLENADHLVPLLDRLASDAAAFRDLLGRGDAAGLREHLEVARRFRQSL